METNAVTQPNSASATEVEQQIATDDFSAYAESANKRDLAKARGESPTTEDSASSKETTLETEQKTETEASAATDDSASSSETAAASETAQTQEQKDKEKKGKTQATSESRWARVTRENRELRERLARVEGAQSATQQRETQQTSQSATERKQQTQTQTGAPKPKIDDKDDKGQAKYATYDDYLDARDNWLREETKREFAEGQQKSQREAQQRQVQETISKEWGNRVQKAQTKYADYDTVALNPELPIKVGSVVDAFILDSDHGTDVLYHLGKHPAELTRINKLNPVAQARELTKIELKLSSPPPARRLTNAPPPPRTVNAQGTTGADEVDAAIKEDDFSAYAASANARDIARHRGH